MNILFTSGGRRVALIRAFQESARRLGLESRIFVADAKDTAPALRLDGVTPLDVPHVTSRDYIPRLVSICQKNHIRLLVPLIDPELRVLASARQQLAEVGTFVLVSSPESVAIGEDKRNTAEFFLRNGFPTPRVFWDARQAAEAGRFPLIVKPARGSSSVGVHCVRDRRELEFFSSYVADSMVQEYITGVEYTMDVLAGMDGRALCCVPRRRIETRAGEVSKGLTVRHPGLIELCTAVVEKMPGAVGCITIQAFVDAAGGIKLIEINPRFGGGYPLSYEAGADYPRAILRMLRNEPAEPIQWNDNVLMLRYDEAIFVKGGQ